jgi:hypothetical protein
MACEFITTCSCIRYFFFYASTHLEAFKIASDVPYFVASCSVTITVSPSSAPPASSAFGNGYALAINSLLSHTCSRVNSISSPVSLFLNVPRFSPRNTHVFSIYKKLFVFSHFTSPCDCLQSLGGSTVGRGGGAFAVFCPSQCLYFVFYAREIRLRISFALHMKTPQECLKRQKEYPNNRVPLAVPSWEGLAFPDCTPMSQVKSTVSNKKKSMALHGSFFLVIPTCGYVPYLIHYLSTVIHVLFLCVYNPCLHIHV